MKSSAAVKRPLRGLLLLGLSLPCLLALPPVSAAPRLIAQQGGGAAPNLPPGVAAALREIAELFRQANDAFQKRDYPAAERGFQAAYERAASISDPYSMGTMLDGLANVYSAQGDPRKALPVQTRAIDLLRRSGHKPGLARALMNIGVTYRQAGQLDSAIRAVEESLGVWDQIGDLPARAAALLSLGDLYKDDGQFTRALATLKQSLEIREATNAGARALAENHLDIGTVHKALAQFGEARREYETGMRLAQSANSPDVYAAGLSNLGGVAADQGNFPEALAAYTKALQLREQGTDPEAVARTLANLSGLAYRWARYDVGLFYARRALAVSERVGAKTLIAGQHVNIGISLSALGQTRKATESLLRALALYGEIGNPDAAKEALFNLAGIAYGEGDYETALRLFSQVMETEQKQGQPLPIAQTTRLLAMTQDALGRPEAALGLFLKANAAFVTLDSPHDLATSYSDLGVVYTRLKRPDDAIRAYTKALELKKRLGVNPQGAANTESNLASLYADLGQLDRSAALMKEAVASVEAARDQVADPSEIGTLQDSRGGLRDIYTRYASVLLRLNRPEDAFLQIERGRGQGLARQAAQGKSAWTGVLPAGDARKMADALAALQQAETALRSVRKQAGLLEIDGDDSSLGSAERETNEASRLRDEAQQAVSALRNEFAARLPRYRAVSGLDDPTMATYTDLAKANPDTLFLSWSVGPDNETLLFALRADTGLKAFSLPIGQAALSKAVGDWREAITPEEQGGAGSDPIREQKAARALYDTLFAAVEKADLLGDGKTKRLVLIGDGPLRELPFAALSGGTGGTGDKRLIERFPLSTGVSLRLLAPAPGGSDLQAARAGRGILCVADPGGGTGSVGPGGDLLLDGFAPLPAARREGKAIEQLFGAGATLLAGNAATKEAVLRTLNTARLLHFATHGYLDRDSGLKSGLLVAPPAASAASDDEPDELPLLTGEEILQRPLSAELVTLSACETGRGQRSGGDGLLGLVWAFRAAGCPSVVASQWSVDDEATGKFMVTFYEALRAGQRRDDALRAAMLAVHGGGAGRTAAPFYWAAFQLHGEATPLAKQSGS